MKQFIQTELEDGSKVLINPSTGEVLDTSNQLVYVVTEEERKKRKEYFSKLNEKELEKKQISETYEKYGNFIWYVYELTTKMFPNIKPSYITRLIFLVTYMGYDGMLRKSPNAPMKKRDLIYCLNIGEREYHNFMKCMSENQIIKEGLVEHKDCYYVNNEVFAKGNVTGGDIVSFAKRNTYITRLYVDGIRRLYESATVRSHKTLSYLFRVIPFINREYNVVCFNPLETDKRKIQPMSLSQMAECLSYEQSNASRLYKILKEITFIVDNQRVRAMRYVTSEIGNYDKYSVFINPKLYYAGSKWNEVEILGEFAS